MKKFLWIFIAVLMATFISGHLWADVRINEFLADNEGSIEDPDEPGEYPDWIEIYNSGPTTVALDGYYLTDDLSNPTQFQIQSGVSVEAGGYIIFWADDDTEQGIYHTNFKLSKSGEEVGLYDSDGTTAIDSYAFGSQTSDISEGRSPDGADNWVFFDPPSPGEANSAPSPTPYTAPTTPPLTTPTTAPASPTPSITPSPQPITPVVLYINEFMADNDATIEDPDDTGKFEDWIELFNPGTESVDLGGMYLTDDTADPTLWQL